MHETGLEDLVVLILVSKDEYSEVQIQVVEVVVLRELR